MSPLPSSPPSTWAWTFPISNPPPLFPDPSFSRKTVASNPAWAWAFWVGLVVVPARRLPPRHVPLPPRVLCRFWKRVVSSPAWPFGAVRLLLLFLFLLPFPPPCGRELAVALTVVRDVRTTLHSECVPSGRGRAPPLDPMFWQSRPCLLFSPPPPFHSAVSQRQQQSTPCRLLSPPPPPLSAVAVPASVVPLLPLGSSNPIRSAPFPFLPSSWSRFRRRHRRARVAIPPPRPPAGRRARLLPRPPWPSRPVAWHRFRP
mmetsp:Transcript_2449/g.5671  ORF Transcript_2449/g.5671 Transcript_2449/m.5671 type:complete len:258 (-) Transcript_2449:166-939(-)